jgi:hypothetical protein
MERRMSLTQLETDFLGDVVTCNGIKPNMKKVKAIRKWKNHFAQKGLRTFFDFTNYYMRFICNFSKIAKPSSD